jgi:hypothetical protein
MQMLSLVKYFLFREISFRHAILLAISSVVNAFDEQSAEINFEQQHIIKLPQ